NEFLILLILILYQNAYFSKIQINYILISTILLIILYITFKIIVYSENKTYFMLFNQPLIVCVYASFIYYQKYLLLLNQKKDFIQKYELNDQSQKINDVLQILLPKFILNKMVSSDISKPIKFQERQGEVSIFFCDICYFDDIIAEKNEKIIPFLDKLFLQFDKFCVKQGLQKIETVGKTYMAAAGLKDFENQIDQRERSIDPVLRASNLAIDMIDYVKDLKWSQKGNKLIIKIGIHYGQVIAGVIGHHKPQFSLIGDTVNTTSRVCSKGGEGEITLSQEAYMRIKDNIKFTFLGPHLVNAKGKDNILLYTLKKAQEKKICRFKKSFLHFYQLYEIINIEFQYFKCFEQKKDLKKRSSSKFNSETYFRLIFQYIGNYLKKTLTDIFEDATLIFADITDFTRYSSARSPEEVLNMLSSLFFKFDKQCQKQSCFKLYTIGDCYVVLGIYNAKERNPALEAKNVVQMAFEMLKIIQIVREEVNFLTLNMRIGIHTGQIIGGITGSNIVRYDVYGTDVMISNKMESNGEPGKIMVSQRTKDLLQSAYKNLYNFEFSKTVNIPTIQKDIGGYFISKVQAEDNINQNELYIQNINYF
ncbi:hypothetical protein IMG5_153650, partial [Ichthyophthirius multifiliis]